jgi:hypothetical protein
VIGELRPSADEIVEALSRREGTVVRPAQGMAANLLRLSEQVSARVVYETDGPSRTVKVGSLTIQLKHRSPRQVRSASPISSLAFAALRSVGKVDVGEARIAHLRETLSANDRALLVSEAAGRLGLAPLAVDRHFRVCWMLGRIFEVKAVAPHVVYKGGTSLSKVFGAIQGLSEDIDLAVSPQALGFAPA